MQAEWHLEKKDFFLNLSEEKESFIQLANRLEVQKNEPIFQEEDTAKSCYYIETGTVRIFRSTLLGKDSTFFIRQEGDMFGLAEVLRSRLRKCNAQAIRKSVIYEMERDIFEKYLSERFSISKRIIEVMGNRLRYLGEQVQNLMLCDVSTRLLKFLFYMGYNTIQDSGSWQKPVSFSINLTQEQIASLTGTCQQTVSETLKKLQEEKLISISGRTVTFLNPMRIRNYYLSEN